MWNLYVFPVYPPWLPINRPSGCFVKLAMDSHSNLDATKSLKFRGQVSVSMLLLFGPSPVEIIGGIWSTSSKEARRSDSPHWHFQSTCLLRCWVTSRSLEYPLSTTRSSALEACLEPGHVRSTPRCQSWWWWMEEAWLHVHFDLPMSVLQGSIDRNIWVVPGDLSVKML